MSIGKRSGDIGDTGRVGRWGIRVRIQPGVKRSLEIRQLDPPSRSLFLHSILQITPSLVAEMTFVLLTNLQFGLGLEAQLVSTSAWLQLEWL